MTFLLYFKQYWKLLGIAVLLLIIGYEYITINNKNNTIKDLKYEIEQLNLEISAKDVSINSYKTAVTDYDSKLNSINVQLKNCNDRLLTQVNDLLTIDEIMESKDEPEVCEITKPTEVTKNANQITNSTERKGIDFINQQFDTIK